MSQLRSLRVAYNEYMKTHHNSMWSEMFRDIIDIAIDEEAKSTRCNCDNCGGK